MFRAFARKLTRPGIVGNLHSRGVVSDRNQTQPLLMAFLNRNPAGHGASGLIRSLRSLTILWVLAMLLGASQVRT